MNIDKFEYDYCKSIKSMLDGNQRLIDLLNMAIDREFWLIEQKIAAKKAYDGLGVA